MTKIGLLSDTHNYLDPAIFKHFAKCDEIWHAGDLGTVEISDILKKFKPLRAVYGNIDGYDVRKLHTEDQRFYCEKVDVWIRHIGGYPGRYSREVRQEIKKNPPKLFICGHSHILKVIYDKKFNLLYINPGAAGRFGLHNIRTVVRFIIDEEDIKELEVIELKD